MRAFLALELPKREVLSLASFRDRAKAVLQNTSAKIRWTRAEQFHLTLRFFGEIEQSQRELIEEAVSQVLELRGNSIEVSAAYLGAFPNWKNPRVLWAGLEQSLPLLELFESLEQAFAARGLGGADKGFKPHITLARIKGSPPGLLAKLLSELRGERWSGEFPLDKLTLFKSELKPTGAVYTPLRVWSLS